VYAIQRVLGEEATSFVEQDAEPQDGFAIAVQGQNQVARTKIS